jgi:hypothetical protein
LESGASIVDEQVNPYQSPAEHERDPGSRPATTYAAEKQRLLYWQLGVSVICGTFMGIATDAGAERIIELGYGLALSLITMRWCDYDSREHGVTLWPHFALTIVCCPGMFLVVPIYLFRSRGSGGWLATLKAIGFFLLLTIVNLATDISVSTLAGNDWLEG